MGPDYNTVCTDAMRLKQWVWPLIGIVILPLSVVCQDSVMVNSCLLTLRLDHTEVVLLAEVITG